MSAHMRMHRINSPIKVIIATKKKQKVSYIKAENIDKLEAFLAKYSEEKEHEEDRGSAWEKLAKERLEKHKRAGLVLRGMRYRENMSQNELAKRSGVSQNEISKIENGKRAVGLKVAKKLAHALNTDHRLFLE